jgi:hypothetical protein
MQVKFIKNARNIYKRERIRSTPQRDMAASIRQARRIASG